MLISAVLALEVMDKEWPLWLVLTGFLGCGVIGMLLCRKWPMMAIVILPLILLAGISQVVELNALTWAKQLGTKRVPGTLCCPTWR
jgi:hypothetical protein